jgi:hypothetical protein
MPDITYPIDSSGLASDYCPTTWAALAVEMNSKQSVTIPSVAGFVAQATAPADTGVIWIETSASIPYVRSIRRYEGADWRRIPAPPAQVYFLDTGAANTITISTGESINDAGFINGRVFVIKLNASVTGATTITVDSIAAKSLYKSGTTEIASGDLVAGQLIMVGYDTTAGHFELLTTLGAVTSPYKCAVVKYTGAAGTAPQAITFGSEATVQFTTAIDPDGFLTLNTHQITLTTGKYLLDFSTPLIRNPASSTSVVFIIRDVTGGNVTIATGTTWVPGGPGSLCHTRVVHPLTITGASNVYDVRVYSESQDIDLGIVMNAGSYAETYQQMSIIKIA